MSRSHFATRTTRRTQFLRRCKMRRMVGRRRLGVASGVVLALLAGGYVATPYVRAASLIVRAANLGGATEALAEDQARAVTVQPPQSIPTRQGNVPVQFYEPSGSVRRTTLMIPGIHSMGIDEPRLKALARDLAASGVRVVTVALPDLTRYRITPQSTDVIEDAVAAFASRADLAPDGRVGIVGISFAGGLSIAAAGRARIRDKLAYVVSFGGHGDLPRVMRYLATGEAPTAPGVETHPPHDYGVAVILYGLADQGIVPPDQVQPLRDGISTFLLASQLTLVNMDHANATFAKAHEIAKTLPEPARTYMTYVNDRQVAKLGPALVPYLTALGADDPALSPDRAPQLPCAPIFLLHGHEDTVIPTAESMVLADYLRAKGVDVHVLLSELITHAEVDRGAAATETWRLISFWAAVLKQ
jgi:pimeloyl-ACP methyl ester carboxylesterase